MSFLPGDAAPAQVLAEQAGKLRDIDPSFSVLSSGPFVCDLGAGWRYTQRLTLEGQEVVQVAVACQVGDVVVLATGAAHAASFAVLESRLSSILGSMSIAV